MICFQLWIEKNISSYAGDNTPYVTYNGVKEVNNFLKEASDELFYWFEDNQMKANPDKCHSLKSSSDEVSICMDSYHI